MGADLFTVESSVSGFSYGEKWGDTRGKEVSLKAKIESLTYRYLTAICYPNPERRFLLLLGFVSGNQSPTPVFLNGRIQPAWMNLQHLQSFTGAVWTNACKYYCWQVIFKRTSNLNRLLCHLWIKQNKTAMGESSFALEDNYGYLQITAYRSDSFLLVRLVAT